MTVRDSRVLWAWGGVGVFLVANTLALAFLFLPAQNAHRALENRIHDLERNVRTLQREGQSSETLLTAMREAEDFSQGFPPRGDLVSLMGRLTKLAGSLALHVPETSYAPSEIKATGLTKVTLQMGVTGTYEKLRRFVYELEGMRRFLVIERLSLADQKATANLQVQLQLAMYLR
jgi:Tfp pilus assembly protein PilO